MSKNIELIVARDLRYGIGLDGKIPWRCDEDMQHFRRTTSATTDPKKQNAVLMGRKTWNSLRKPLENRVNICLSSSPQTIPTFATMEAAIAYANNDSMVETIFIIGGAAVYRKALETLQIDRVWMTIIKREFPTDRTINFIKNYLKNCRGILVRETDEFIIWSYDLSII